MQHVFLVGAKSLGAYGGYETFINKLTEYHQNNQNIKYYVDCKANGCMDEGTLASVTDEKMVVGKDGKQKCVEFTYHNAHCFKIDIPQKLGPAQAIYYDVAALKKCCENIKEQKIHRLGGSVYLNPDGAGGIIGTQKSSFFSFNGALNLITGGAA